MQNKVLSFSDGKFRIVQIADVQEGYPVSVDSLRLLRAALDNCKPDLAVFTGDQIKGYAPSVRGEKGKANIEKAIHDIIRPLEERSIPFAVTYGNHDGQGALLNGEQFEIYKSSPMFVFSDPAAENDKGTMCLSVSNGDKDAALIYLLDTHSNSPEGGYSSVHPEQIEWYKTVRDEYETKNGKCLPSFAFQHIPTPEFYKVIKKVKRFTGGAVRAYGNHKNEYYVLDPDNSGKDDFMGESPAAPYRYSGEVDAFLEKGEVRALFVGHDHNNSFVSDYNGISLAYTQSVGFGAYGPDLNRGVRVIDIFPDGTWNTFTLTYSELLGKKINEKAKYYFYKLCPSSMAGFKTAVRETGIAAAALGLTASGIYYLIKRKENKK